MFRVAVVNEVAADGRSLASLVDYEDTNGKLHSGWVLLWRNSGALLRWVPALERWQNKKCPSSFWAATDGCCFSKVRVHSSRPGKDAVGRFAVFATRCIFRGCRTYVQVARLCLRKKKKTQARPLCSYSTIAELLFYCLICLGSNRYRFT